jgi:hypothetical protein
MSPWFNRKKIEVRTCIFDYTMFRMKRICILQITQFFRAKKWKSFKNQKILILNLWKGDNPRDRNILKCVESLIQVIGNFGQQLPSKCKKLFSYIFKRVACHVLFGFYFVIFGEYACQWKWNPFQGNVVKTYYHFGDKRVCSMNWKFQLARIPNIIKNLNDKLLCIRKTLHNVW